MTWAKVHTPRPLCKSGCANSKDKTAGGKTYEQLRDSDSDGLSQFCWMGGDTVTIDIDPASLIYRDRFFGTIPDESSPPRTRFLTAGFLCDQLVHAAMGHHDIWRIVCFSH